MTDGAVLEGTASFANTTFEGELHNYEWFVRQTQLPQYVNAYGSVVGVLTNMTLNGRLVFHTSSNWPGILTLSSGQFNSAGEVRLDGNGSVEFEGSNPFNKIDYPSQFNGIIGIGPGITIHGQTLTINVPLVNNQGTITTTPGDQLVFNSSTVTNSGVLHISSSTVITGVSPFVQTARGRLEFDLAGTTAGTGYGQLNPSAVQLDGVLSVKLIAPFQPAVGNSFKLISFKNGAGKFGSILTPPLTGAVSWDPQYNTSDFSLNVR
jgi:hypothetical protein